MLEAAKLNPLVEWPDDDPEGFWETAGVCAGCQNPNECIDALECIISSPEHADLP